MVKDLFFSIGLLFVLDRPLSSLALKEKEKKKAREKLELRAIF